MPPLRDHRDSPLDDLLHRKVIDPLSLEDDLPGIQAAEPCDRTEHRGFSRTVGPDQRHDLPSVQRDGDTAERPDAIVGDVHVLRLEHQNPTSSSSCPR